MAYPTKIATCCYCGTRAALVLKGAERHELACSSCGAPLHDLKKLPRDRTGDRELLERPRTSFAYANKAPKPSKKKKSKKRKSWLKDVFEEAFDLIEDVFD